MNKKQLISIISPAFNEKDNIFPLVKEIKKQLQPLKKYCYEIILVDDGSTDKTWQKISQLAKKDKRIKGIRLTRNFGQQAALTAGLDTARGKAVIYLDSDLQHPPSLFSKMIKKWEKGAEIVHTVRTETENISFLKSFFSRSFYFLLNQCRNWKILRTYFSTEQS